jgi:hypothetical protein
MSAYIEYDIAWPNDFLKSLRLLRLISSPKKIAAAGKQPFLTRKWTTQDGECDSVHGISTL